MITKHEKYINLKFWLNSVDQLGWLFSLQKTIVLEKLEIDKNYKYY